MRVRVRVRVRVRAVDNMCARVSCQDRRLNHNDEDFRVRKVVSEEG